MAPCGGCLAASSPPLTLHGAAALALAGYAALAWASRGSEPVPIAGYLAVAALGWVAAIAAWAAARAGRPLPTWALVGWGLAFRLCGLAAEPVYEDDHWRYLWDGHVFATRGNPYGLAPLEAFADPAVPAAFQAVLDRVNQPHLPTVYGPLPELAFLAAHAAAPGSLLALKLLWLAAELLALALLARRAGPALALGWWCPLLVLEVAFNAHFEPLGIAALVGAMVAAGAGRGVLAGLALALAISTRPFAVLLAPLVLRRAGARGAVACAVAVAALHLPFVLGGRGLEGAGLAAMALDWEYNSSLFALARAALGDGGARVAAGAIIAIAWVAVAARDRGEPTRWPAGDLALAPFLFAGPVLNPWYALWLIPFAIVRPSRWAWTTTAAVTLAYVHGHQLAGSAGGYDHPAWVRPLEFGAIGIAALLDLRRRSERD